MYKVAKLTSIAAFSGIFLVSWLTTANAFQIPEPATIDVGGQAASAYTEESLGSTNGVSSVLSSSEVRHITWCAARYRLGYDALNDTYVSNDGERARCISPR